MASGLLGESEYSICSTTCIRLVRVGRNNIHGINGFSPTVRFQKLISGIIAEPVPVAKCKGNFRIR